MEPLPEPILGSVEDIADAMGDPDQADQAVVSMLKLFGIGIYAADGTPISVGAETSDADFYLFEPEVRNLIEMLRSGLNGEDWMPFSDFHDAIVGMGVDISEQDLAAAYQDAYSENPDAAISRFAPYVGVEAPLPPFGAWLLYVDGFVPVEGSSPSARVGGLALAQRSQNLGLARQKLSQRINSNQFQNALAQSANNAHIIAMVGKATLSVDAQPYIAHEGHAGGPGAPVTLTATIHAQSPVSPFNGQPVIQGCPNALLAGVGISWQYSGPAVDHGTSAIVNGATDGSGQTRLTYTPNEEKAKGHGYELRVVGSFTATAQASELAQKVYCASPAVASFVHRNIPGTANISIGWHEPYAIHIKATLANYSVSFKVLGSGAKTTGTDTFEGNLVQQDDGSWHGTVSATANGGWSGQAVLFLGGQGRCSTTWNSSQQLEVFTQPTPDGKLLLQFYPVTAPSQPTGSGKCGYTRHQINGIYYAPYGDGSMMEAAAGQGLAIRLPPKPGGTDDEPYYVSLPAGGIISNTKWHFEVQWLEPPPP